MSYPKSLKLNNEGNTLPVALMIAVILTFILTSLSKQALTFAKTTNNDFEKVSTYSLAKGRIDISISEFITYIDTTEDFTSFENTEISRIKTEYGVDVINDSANFDLNVASLPTYVYKFSYSLDGHTISKHAYVSTGGLSTNVFFPYDFTIATAGDLILNSAVSIGANIYGENTYMFDHSLYEDIQNSNNKVITPDMSPFWTYYYDFDDLQKIPSMLYYNNFKYCEINCFQTTSNTEPWVINKNNYLDIDQNYSGTLPDKDTLYISDFFGGFDYDTYFFDAVTNMAPTNDFVITETVDFLNISSVIQSYTMPVPSKNPSPGQEAHFYEYYQSDFNTDFILEYSGYVNGNLNINNDLAIKDNKNKDFLIVDGDLTIDGPLQISGTFIVLGDLYFTGQTIHTSSTFYVKGQTFIDFDYDHGFDTTENEGQAIYAKDNILFLNHFSNTSAFPYSPTNESILSVFYTEESIYINGAYSYIYSEGCLLAAAKGNSPNKLNFKENDLTGNNINGIIINGYNGYLNLSGGSYTAVPESVPDVISNVRVVFKGYNNSNFPTSKFKNLPTIQPISFVQAGVFTYETSEFHYD